MHKCPFNFPAGYHWYGIKQTSPGHPTKWVDQLLARGDESGTEDADDAIDHCEHDSVDEDVGTTDVTHKRNLGYPFRLVMFLLLRQLIIHEGLRLE